MILVTGGMGLVGSNLIKSLNSIGYENIIIIDNLKNKFEKKKLNISNLKYKEIIDLEDFYISPIKYFKNLKIIFHQGACTDTTETDYIKMNLLNFEYSKILLNYALEYNVRFIYASSAAVYGMGYNGFSVHPNCEKPLNIYAESKLKFDNYVRNIIGTTETQIAGLRYFNVYGPGESHKDFMASTIYHFYHQILKNGEMRLFKSNQLEIEDGMQKRDFIFVEDCIKLNLNLLNNPSISGIFNAGTGLARPFLDVALSIKNWFENYKKFIPEIKFIEFPEKLIGKYQNFTQSDNTNQNIINNDIEFISLEKGIAKYLKLLNE